MRGRPRDMRTRILGPTFTPSKKCWRVILLRPADEKRKRIERGAKTEEEAKRIASLTPEQFIAELPESRLKKRRRPDWVYFIRCGERGPIKIGRASDVRRRLDGLQAANHQELRLLAATRNLSEKDLHRRFRRFRIRGEWFRVSRDLVSVITSITELPGSI